MTSPESGEDLLARVIREYDAQGIHRTGTEVDTASARWLADLIAEIGFEPVLQPIAFERIDSIEAFVDVEPSPGASRSEWKRFEGIPLVDSASFTDPQGIEGRLVPTDRAEDSVSETAIAVTRLPARAQYLPSFHEARESFAALVIVTGGAEFDLPEGVTMEPLPAGYALINADRFTTPYGGPVLQLPSESGPELVAARERRARARFVVTVERTPTTIFNVTTIVPGSSTEEAPVVVMTPRSGWWNNASERGGGLAVFVELLRLLRENPPVRTVHFVASTGHELGHVGLEHYLEENRELVSGAHLWLHLGANFAAAVGGGIRLQASDQDLLDRTVTGLEQGGVEIEAVTPIADRPYGEAREIHDGGGRFLSVLGRNGLFRSPQDRWPEAVDMDLLRELTEVITRLVLEESGSGAETGAALGR